MMAVTEAWGPVSSLKVGSYDKVILVQEGGTQEVT